MKRHSLLVIGLVCLLMACGSRKSELQLSVERQSLSVKETAQYDITAQGLVNARVESFDDGFTVTPVNPDKPMTYTAPDGKRTTVENGVLDKRSKKETARTEAKTNVNAYGNSETEIKASSYKKDKEKKTEREADWSFLWVLFVIILFMVGRQLYKNMNW